MCSCRFNSPKPFTQWRILLLRNLQALFSPPFYIFFFLSCFHAIIGSQISQYILDWWSLRKARFISSHTEPPRCPQWNCSKLSLRDEPSIRNTKKYTKIGTTLRVAGNEGVVWCGMPGEERGVQGGSPKSQALCAAWHWALLPQHGASISAHPLLGCASWQTNRNSREKEKPSQCRDWVISKEAENELRRIECFQIVFSNDRCICVCLNLDFM